MATMTKRTKLDAIRDILYDLAPSVFFLGNKAVRKMSNGRNAEITLYTELVGGKYVGLRVNIIDKNQGSIAVNDFNFDQYLRNKADMSHPNAEGVHKMHIWDNDYQWYIVKPTDLRPLVDAIFEYIELYEGE